MMTIEQMIDHLANLGQIHGLDAPVKVWNLGDSIDSLDVRDIAGVFTGWDERTQRQIATLRLEQP